MKRLCRPSARRAVKLGCCVLLVSAFSISVAGCAGRAEGTSHAASASEASAPPKPEAATPSPAPTHESADAASVDSANVDETPPDVAPAEADADAEQHVGLGNIGTLGQPKQHAAPREQEQRPRPPRIREGLTSAHGSLKVVVIQRIVHENFGRFRVCYAEGLKRNADLKGRVFIHFTIGSDGTIKSKSSTRDSDLRDAEVVACILRDVADMSFPSPKNGVVTATYELLLDPPEDE